MVIIPLVVAAAVIAGGLWDRDEDGRPAFHVTLASPDLYVDGVYSKEVFLDGGQYAFRFVPNGDSPRVLSVSLRGETLDFSEDFELVGTIHQTGISEYYTWEYDGQRVVTVPDTGSFLVEINPNGNIMGAVSVDMIKN